MDKRISNNIIVGIFVAVGFALFVFLLFTMGGGQGIFRSHFALYGRFPHVKGLHPGSEVSLSGLRIGTVKTITVATDETKELIVEMSITSSFRDKIRKDSVAKVVTQGVLGDKYIEISIGSPDAPVIEPNSQIPTQEVQDLFAKGGGLVEDIAKHFKNGGDFETFIKNLNIISHNLAVLTTDLSKDKGLIHEITRGTSGQKLNSSLTHLDNILKKVDSGEGTLGALMNDPTVYEDIKNILGGAKRSNVLKYFMRQFMEDGQKAPKKQD